MLRRFHPPAPALRRLPLAALLVVFAAGCAGAGADPGPATAGGELRAERGELRRRSLLTGELRAERAHDVVVPRSPTWQVQIRWMAEDGTRVEAGQKVLELDNDQFASELEEKRLTLAEREEALARRLAEVALDRADRRFAVAERRAELEKARLAAAVPESLLAKRDYQERQLALRKAEVELAKAEEELRASELRGEAEIEVEQIALQRARREIATAERALRDLSLAAPADGILVIEEHPWEGRKLQAGDSVWVGLTVMRIPDLASMQVEAELADVDDGEVRPGMEVRCSLDTYPDRELAGRVTSVSPIARQDETQGSLRRFFTVHVELSEHDAELLRPGMSVKVEVLGEPRRGLLVPRAALDLAAEPPRVHLAAGGSTEVRIGGCDAMRCVVEAGIDEGTRLTPAGGGQGAL